VTNTLAYYDLVTIMAVKRFIGPYPDRCSAWTGSSLTEKH